MDKLQVLLARGAFELRQWASNPPTVISHQPPEAWSDSTELRIAQGQLNTPESALGLLWRCQLDTLSYRVRSFDFNEITMRAIYKVLASQ